MSAYSDWKCGSMTDGEYRSVIAAEDARDRAIDEAEWAAYLDEGDLEDNGNDY